MMTSAQVVETSVNVTSNSPSQDYTHLDDHNLPNYEYYIEGKGITQAGRKKSQLLHLAGIEVQDLYEDLVDPGPVNASTDDDYKVCIRKLDAHFHAEDNVPYERHVFRHRETADKFMVRLRKQARHCNFGESLEDNVRDQLIEKLPDIEWKKKLLEVKCCGYSFFLCSLLYVNVFSRFCMLLF